MPRGALAGCHVPLSHLELCHLLFQVDDELLDPGVISFIVAELFLTGKYKKGCLRGPL